MMALIIVLLVPLIIAAAAWYLVERWKQTRICNTCQHLKRIEGLTEYRCHKEYGSFRPPRWCADYVRRLPEDEENEL